MIGSSKATGLTLLLETALAVAFLFAAGAATAGADWPLWDGKESVADYAKRAGIQEVQKDLDLGNGVTMKLTLIPAGKYLMGRRPEQAVDIEGVRVLVKEAEEGAGWNTSPQREVTLTRPFYMGVYEVTQEQYERVMGANPSTFKGKTNPVESIAWPQAVLFCRKLSAVTGMAISLPTEAQWEYAFRAGTTTKFYWGDDPADMYRFENYADKSMTTGGLKGKIEGAYARRDQEHDDGFANTAPVGSFKPNPWGLYDMHGNVGELIRDCFTVNLHGAPTLDPQGPGYANGFGGGGGISPHYGKGSDWGHGPSAYFNRPQYGSPFSSFCGGFRVVADVKSNALPPREAKNEAPRKATPAPAPAGAADPKVRVPPGCRAAAGTQAEPYTKTGWAQAIVHEATGMEMVYIPAGSFLMGMPPWVDGEPGADETARWLGYQQVGRQRRVTLSYGFYMGKTEVTQAQWEKVMGKNPAHFSGKTSVEDVLMKYQAIVAQHDAGPDAPVEMVSWDDCQAFCEKAGGGLRLPTEAEWEYACRAGTQGPYSGNMDDMGWHIGNSDGTTHPVGMKKPNPWGLYDMHGNVWEWCSDWHAHDEGTEDKTDPTGPTKASGFPQARVIRGGGWGDYGSHCLAAIRGAFKVGGNPGPAFCAVGVRLVIPATGSP